MLFDLCASPLRPTTETGKDLKRIPAKNTHAP